MNHLKRCLINTVRPMMLTLALLPLFSLSVAADSLPAPVSLNSGWELFDAAYLPDGKTLSTSQYDALLTADNFTHNGAVVPGTVLTSLVRNGVYPDPMYGENNRTIPEWLNKESYWYLTKFSVPSSYSGKSIWLNFDGINYEADIWLNGHDLGQIKGAFARGIFNITAYATASGNNILAVHILPMPHTGVPHEHTQAAGTGGNGGATAEDGPTFLSTIGWDWIPAIRDRDMGIWQGVSLSCSGPVTVNDPYVSSDLPLPETDSANLTLETTLRNTTDKPQIGNLEAQFGKTSFKYPVTLQPNENRTLVLGPATVPQLQVLNPRLWWPNGYGAPNLYRLHLAFTQNGAVSDVKEINFGIRKITYALPGSSNLALSVNGVPVMVKGGDWGIDEAMKNIPRARLEAQIRMHQMANYDVIRNWVGQSTSEDFYDLCDRYGIMVWDEFFQPNPSDGPNPDDSALYLANVREKILRFRSHPSIILWCARNEGDPPPVIDKGIQQLINELELDRLYQPSSGGGRGVGSGGPYSWRAPRTYYVYNEAFKTEIGSVSIPTLESIREMMPEKDWNGLNDDWAEHDLCRGAQGGDWYPNMLNGRYGPVVTLEDFVRKAQMADYEAYRAMYEGRFARLFSPESGVLTWMSNPAQPSFVWQIYSHDLEPNSAFFAVRKACEPIHVQMNQSNWHVMVINNSPHSLDSVTVKTGIYNLDGTLQSTRENTVTAGPSAATDIGAVQWPKTLSTVHFIKIELKDSNGKLLSDNFYWRADPDNPDNFRMLNSLPTVALTATGARHDSSGECRIDVTLTNPTRSVALMAHLQLRGKESGKRILPVYYTDNYVSLLPGEKKKITVEASIADLNGDSPIIDVDGWNVTVTGSTQKGLVPFEANADAGYGHAWPAFVYDSDIHCGGSAVGAFVTDKDFRGGKVLVTTDPVSTDGIPNAAPQAVYQTARQGFVTYTIPVRPLSNGASYTVRLHFAETAFSTAGARKFTVLINGDNALTDFDVLAAAGGKDRALVKDFPGIKPDPNGNIAITFRPPGPFVPGQRPPGPNAPNQPIISGIQIISGGDSYE